MSNTPSLLGCPFCGGEARHLPGKSGYWIERVICDACHFHLLETGSHTAVERWNRRTPQPADCTRSHPHEDMSGYCLLRTEIARLANENARLRASQSVVREPLTPEQVSEIADAAHREYDRLVSSGQCAPRWSAVFAYLLERAHGITQKGGSNAE